MSENPGGSCEPCKKKKCKCDRQLPLCGQCEGTNLICKYAEGNKRGIPTGYLGTLEQRLNETEAALYQALREIQALKRQDTMIIEQIPVVTSSRPRLATPELNVNKTARMAEWKEYPLQTSEGIEKWKDFFSRNEISKLELPRETTMETIERSTETVATQHLIRGQSIRQLPIPNDDRPIIDSEALSSDENRSSGTLRPSSATVQAAAVSFPEVSVNSDSFQSGDYSAGYQSFVSLQSDIRYQRANPAEMSQRAGSGFATTQDLPAEASLSNRSQQLSAMFRNTYY